MIQTKLSTSVFSFVFLLSGFISKYGRGGVVTWVKMDDLLEELNGKREVTRLHISPSMGCS